MVDTMFPLRAGGRDIELDLPWQHRPRQFLHRLGALPRAY